MIPNRASWCQVRREDGVRLHSLAYKLQQQRIESGLSEGQERLWDQIIGELEWRSARTRRGYKRCACELCFIDPFDADGYTEVPY